MYRAWDLPANDEAGDGAELLVPATQPVGPSQSQPTPTPQEEEPLARLVSMDSQVASINCTLDTMLLGRKNTCTVVLDDPTVSATHCRIYYDDNVPMGSLRPELVLQHAEQQQAAKQAAAWPPARSINTNGEVFFGASHFWIEDLSSNGTFVNMVKLGRNCRARLCHNDVISLCKPEQKRKTKGTKMTWQFKLNCPQKLEKDQQEYPEEIRNRYTIKDTLGVGAFSEVKMAVERETGRLVAVKMLDKFRYTGGTRTGESLSREVEILKRLSHPNIIQILDVVDTERMLFIVLELASGGELFEQIAKRNRHTEDEARHVFEQLLRAIQYLHSNNICHRDIKPENVLLEGDVVKLTDFGFSRVVGEAEMMKTMCGTPCYLAPEVLAMAMGTKEPEFESAYGYGKAVDMWSLGVVLFILLSGRPPWDDSNFGHLCETVLSGVVVFPIERWDGVSAIARDLCQRLMTRDPLARVTVDEALLHPWVTGAQVGQELEQAVTLSPPPRNHVKNREFAIPSSKKKPRPSDRDEQRKENAVLRLIQERESNGPALSPDLARCSVSSAETTPLLPPSSPLVFEEDPAGASPIARKLGFEFETPEKVKRPKMQLE